jgi:pimeloyl-ACP methyl ester carboxylesterase
MKVPRFVRGWLSILGVLVFPIGRFLGPLLAHLRTPERYERGLVLVLPGIEGESCINHSIARGLADGGVEGAIEIFDWTTGIVLLLFYHLRRWKRNVVQAQRLARRITDYQTRYPGRPVHLVGHSGGGALALLALERLDPSRQISGAVLLLPGISPGYDLVPALLHCEQSIWHFRSICDVLFLGLLTTVAGTIDRKHTPSAGMLGFRSPAQLDPEHEALVRTRFCDMPFRLEMIASFNFAGHFGAANRVFVAEWVAPLLTRGKTVAVEPVPAAYALEQGLAG